MKKIIFLAVIIALLVIMCGGCHRPPVCPTYDGAFRAKKQLKQEKRGGEMGVCAYQKSITKKEKRRASRIWNSEHCN